MPHTLPIGIVVIRGVRVNNNVGVSLIERIFTRFVNDESFVAAVFSSVYPDLFFTHVEFNQELIFHEHPNLVFYFVVFLMNAEIFDPIDVGVLRYRGIYLLNRVGSIVNPHFTMKQKFLFSTRKKFQFVTPFSFNEGAVYQSVIVKPKSISRYGRSETFREDDNFVIVDIYVLVHVAQELIHTLIFYSSYSGAFDYFFRNFRVAAVIKI